jgi:hypothetical protein
VSDFFAPPPPPPKPTGAQPRIVMLRAPNGSLPGIVAAEAILGRSAAATISLSRFAVYPTGIQLRLMVTLIDEFSDLDPFEFRLRSRGRATDPAAPDRLNFGFAFADGSKATNLEGGWRMTGDRDSSTPELLSTGSGFGAGEGGASYWLSPLPPTGSIEAVVEWRAAGIGLSRHALDDAAIAAAAGRAQKIFDDERGGGWS